MSEEKNKYDFEQITPWDGEKDTGYDVRMKWKRNFERVKSFIAEVRNELAEIGDSLSTKFLRKDQDDRTEHSLGVGGSIDVDGEVRVGSLLKTLNAILSLLSGQGTIIKDGLV